MTKHSKHSHHRSSRKSSPAPTIVADVPPWSETRQEPDVQWVPITPIEVPLKTVNVPIYNSCEDPTPQWAANVIISHHGHNFLNHFKEDILMYIYGRNPQSNTVNAGGRHWQ